MKKGKMLIKMILCVLLIPLFIEAQVTDFDFIYTDINGKSNFEPFEQVKFERPENSRTAPVQVPGWPISIGQNSYFPPSGVCLADIFEDGLLAIIAGSSNGVFYVKNYQGNDFSGWPKTGLEPIRTKAAVGDIDPDYPGLEIVVPSETGTVYVWHNDGTPVTGWPQSIVNGVTGRCKSPVIFDIDNDGTLEIIIGQGNVNVFNHDGTMYPGWPKTLDGDCSATVSVADVDNDGVVEICALSWYSVYLWDKDGNNEPGWPLLNVAGEMSYAQPVLADLDDDGDMEIIHAYYDQWSSPSQNHVGIYHHDGTNFDNWPQDYPGPHAFVTPVVGDLDNDGDLEIFGGGHTFDVMAKHHTGETVAGWPVQIGTALDGSPIVFDIDDDGNRDIVVAEDGVVGMCDIWAFHGDGSTVVDWPVPTPAPALMNSAAVGDVDGDGDIEIALITMYGVISLWTLENIPYRSYLTDWGTYFHDNWNTGWFHPLSPQNLTADISGNSVNLSWNANTEPDLAGYNIYKSEISGGPYAKLNSTLITDTSYNDITGMENNYYCVTAEIKGSAESRLSNELFCLITSINEQYEQLSSISVSPNPFKHSATIIYTIHKPANISLEIYNSKGKLIETLIAEHQEAGRHSVVWNAANRSPGMYFYKLCVEPGLSGKEGTYSIIRKIILMK
ncbi:MAG: T9SS type A sorting domain-containing protein [Bacteroidales bacterium]|nr:T9SS type A sorting domain-containing protein [Bacteroidales bacterium]